MQPNSPELDWAGKRCGHNHPPAECPHARCGYREALVEVERLRAVDTALQDDKKRLDWMQSLIDPSRQIDANGCFIQKIYGFRGETLREALDSGMRAAAIRAVGQHQAPDDQRERGGGE